MQDLNIPLIIQPQAFGVLAMVSWAQVRATRLQTVVSLTGRQCQYYSKHRSITTCVALFISILAVCGGFEAGMVFAVRVGAMTFL